jgi:hypothetical protein
LLLLEEFALPLLAAVAAAIITASSLAGSCGSHSINSPDA